MHSEREKILRQQLAAARTTHSVNQPVFDWIDLQTVFDALDLLRKELSACHEKDLHASAFPREQPLPD